MLFANIYIVYVSSFIIANKQVRVFKQKILTKDISQLIRSIVIDVFGLKTSFDFSGILYYIMNIPLFFIAYKSKLLLVQILRKRKSS